MQEIHAKLLISRLSLVQNIFYHYIHGMKRLIIPIICMLLSLAGCHERKPLPSLELADSLLTDAGDKSGSFAHLPANRRAAAKPARPLQ